jgi:hypothetical protein
MEIREVQRLGAILTLDVDGKIRDFFVLKEEKEFSTYSSSLVKGGDCISYFATLAEVVDRTYDSYGLHFVTSFEKYEYFHGWFGLEFKIGFKELDEPAKK